MIINQLLMAWLDWIIEADSPLIGGLRLFIPAMIIQVTGWVIVEFWNYARKEKGGGE